MTPASHVLMTPGPELRRRAPGSLPQPLGELPRQSAWRDVTFSFQGTGTIIPWKFIPSFMIPSSKSPMKFIPIVQISKKNVYFFAFSFVGWPIDPRASGNDSRHLWHPLAAAHSAARWRPARPPPAVPRYLGEGPKGEGRREDFAENLALYGKLWE